MTHIDRATAARTHHQPRAARRGRRLSTYAATLPLLGLITLAATPAHAAGSWTEINSMETRRERPSATLLNDGRVFVAGTSNYGPWPSTGGWAEIYDPSNGNWTLAIANKWLNFDHTATVLGDGRVLIAGGRSTAAGTSAVNVYDPVAGTIVATGNLAGPRFNHAAVRLDDGDVFIAGGEGVNGGAGQGSQYTAEVYDVATGTWSLVPPMTVGKTRPQAVKLNDGRVLVVGGFAGEIYDPATNSWSSTGPLGSTSGGLNHTLTSLGDGRVLVVGGSAGSGGTAAAAVYSPATNAWSAAGSMNVGRSFHTATGLADGKVLVAGGHQVAASQTAEVYDPATNSWTATPGLVKRRDLHEAVRLWNGNVLIMGTVLGTSADRKSAEVYVP